MGAELNRTRGRQPLVHSGSCVLPTVVADQGDKAAERFFTFFTDTIRNKNTRASYYRNAMRFFAWAEERGLGLKQIRSYHVSAYLELLAADHASPSVKQHLATLRMLFDWLILGQVLESNPAGAVRGPKHVVRRGKTPVLRPEEARKLIDGIDTRSLIGLRDRALIGVMVYSFARVTAVLAMKGKDYYVEGGRPWFRLHEKGGKRHEVPAHPTAVQYLDEYLAVSSFARERKSPLFRSIDRSRNLTSRPMHRNDVLRMIKNHARNVGLPEAIGCHTFRATGITTYLENGGSIENAQAIANHESPRTTKLYDRTDDRARCTDIDRIVI